jgi:hypothetical protein
VRVAGVVLEGDGVAGLDDELVGLTDERPAIGAQKHLLCHGAVSQHGVGGNSRGGSGLAKGGVHGEGGPPSVEGRSSGDARRETNTRLREWIPRREKPQHGLQKHGCH